MVFDLNTRRLEMNSLNSYAAVTLVTLILGAHTAFAAKVESPSAQGEQITQPGYMIQLTTEGIESQAIEPDASGGGDVLNLVLSVNHIDCMEKWYGANLLYAV